MSRLRTLATKQLGERGNNSNLFATLFVLLSVTSLSSCETPSGTKLPLGGPEDVSFATRLWSSMAAARLVGPDAKPLKPFFGGAKPHGMILELAHQDLRVGDHTGYLVLKNNHDGPGVSVAAVKKDAKRFLTSVTVMYVREKGYDADNQNWFWAKYGPTGTLFKLNMDARSVAMAGRIVKGKTPGESRGCIFCHRSAGGGDYIFYPRARQSKSGPRAR